VNLPNAITLLRLLLVPVTIWLILSGYYVTAFWVFLVAGISDGIDGFLARHLNQKTLLGAILDPIADKALLVSIFVMLGFKDHLPLWLVVLVVFRDVLIVGGYLLGHVLGRPNEVKPLWVSKANTAAQILLAAVALWEWTQPRVLGPVVDGLIWITAVTTTVSGVAYIVVWARGLRRE
jgi:cardiolipin synthase